MVDGRVWRVKTPCQISSQCHSERERKYSCLTSPEWGHGKAVSSLATVRFSFAWQMAQNHVLQSVNSLQEYKREKVYC